MRLLCWYGVLQNPPIRSADAALNKRLEKATRAIVRFIQVQHRMRVLSLAVDYTIDTSAGGDGDGELVVVWTSSLRAAAGAAARDLRLADVQLEPRQRSKVL